MPVYRFSMQLCRNEADAEDLTQECFHLAFRKFHQFRGGSNCRAWLFRIARNAHIDRLRRSTREPRSIDMQEMSPRQEPEAKELNRDPLEDLASWSVLAIDENMGQHFIVFGPTPEDENGGSRGRTSTGWRRPRRTTRRGEAGGT